MQKYYIASISMEKIQWSIKRVYTEDTCQFYHPPLTLSFNDT